MDADPTTERRRIFLLLAIVAVAAGVGAVGLLSRIGDDAGPFIAGIALGDCFTYPGDDSEFVDLDVVSCDDVHYGEVYGIVVSGDTGECVTQFESYTGVENYWATEYIIGFLPIDRDRMYCYAYAASDFGGSLRR